MAHAAAAPLTLPEAVASALARGDAARIARLETGQAEDAVGEARSAYWPHLAVTSGAGYSNRQFEKLRAVNLAGQQKVYGLQSLGSDQGWLNVEIQQLLFDLGNWHRIEQRELAADAARTAEDERRDATAEDVLMRFVRVLRVEGRREVAAGRLEQARWLDGQTRSLLEAGRAVETDRRQAMVAAEEAALELRTRDAELAEARNALRLAMGDAEADVSSLDAGSVPAPEAPAADVASDQSLAATPALKVLELRRRMEETGVEAARAERYPTVGMQAGYSNYGPNRYDNYPDEVRVNVALRVPIFDGHRTTYAVANAARGAEIAQVRHRALLERKRVRVRELLGLLAAGQEGPAIAARRAELARERVRLADLTLQEQRGSVTDALAARDLWTRDAAAAVDARYDRVELWATLMRETGRLASAIMGPPGAAPAATATP